MWREFRVTGATKSGRERAVPLPSKVVETLERLEHCTGYVFYLRVPRFQMHPDTITHRFRDVREEVLPSREGFSFHSLRHSYCTWLAEAGTPVHVIKGLAGHSSVTTTMRYIHALSEGQRHVDRAFG